MGSKGLISGVYSQPLFAVNAKLETRQQRSQRLREQEIARQKRLQKQARAKNAGGIAAGPAKHWTSLEPRTSDKSVRANYLRDHGTESENRLRDALKSLEPRVRFDASVLLFGYIADFYCDRLRLVLELDGRFHADRKEQDRTRDMHLEKRGIKTLRFPSSMAFTDLGRIISTVRAFAESRVTANVSAASGGSPATANTQDVNRNASAGFGNR